MKYIKKIFKICSVFFLFLLLLPLLLYIPFFYDKHFYKNLIIENVKNYSDYKIELETLDLSVYPSLKINLKKIILKTKEKNLLLIKLEEVNFAVFFLGFLGDGKLEIADISLRNGFVDIPALLNSLPKEDTTNKENTEKISQDIINLIHNRLQIKQILFENIELQIKQFHRSIYHNPIIKEIKLSYESFLDSKVSINIDYGKTNITLIGSFGISPSQLNLDSIFFEDELTISNFPVYEYSSYLRDFPKLNISGSNINLKIKSQKIKDQITIANHVDLTLNHIGYKNKENINKRIGSITLKGNIDYPLFTKRIITKSLNLNLSSLCNFQLDSDLNFNHRPTIKANLSSSFVHLSPIIDFAGAFSKPEKINDQTSNHTTEEVSQKNLNILLDLKYNANLVSFKNFEIKHFFLNTILRNSSLEYNAGIRKLSEGNLRLSGETNLLNGISANAYIELENVNLEKFTTEFLGKKMAEGTLSTYIKLQTDNKYGEKDFLKNLHLTGFTNIKDGILLDRADILYPIRFLNKIIPTEDKLNTNISRFNYIDIDYMIKNQRFKMNNLKMNGKIFNTTGTADIGLENPSEDIHANLIVSTSVGGAGLKIPMVYSKSSYVPFSIDKVWLASVYTGMVMGGPVGAMIGSVLSESANTAIDTIKNKSEETFR